MRPKYDQNDAIARLGHWRDAGRLMRMIEVRDVSKQYGSFTALQGVSFDCKPGTVTGLLGPNGAGKSTLMRIMVGLGRAGTGTVTYDGTPFAELSSPGHTVGVMLDAGAQHDGRTGAEILTLGAMALRIRRSRVDEVLELVGLSPSEAKRRLRNYSLGMRQRLGIAHALLAEPQVLIFDEPANGLDPSGIRWIRQLLARHADQGGTVLLSSHLIHEVELIADELVLIGHGQVLATGPKDQLLGDLGTAKTLVRAVDQRTLETVIAEAGISLHADADALTADTTPDRIGALAAEHRIALTELRPVGGNLEDEFFRLTESTAREGNL